MREIQIAASAAGHRLLRNDNGVGTNHRGMPLRYGLGPGSSDLIGWTRNGRFAAIEVKTHPRKAKVEQLRFIAAVNTAGGVGAVVYSVSEALEALAR